MYPPAMMPQQVPTDPPPQQHPVVGQWYDIPGKGRFRYLGGDPVASDSWAGEAKPVEFTSISPRTLGKAAVTAAGLLVPEVGLPARAAIGGVEGAAYGLLDRAPGESALGAATTGGLLGAAAGVASDPVSRAAGGLLRNVGRTVGRATAKAAGTLRTEGEAVTAWLREAAQAPTYAGARRAIREGIETTRKTLYKPIEKLVIHDKKVNVVMRELADNGWLPGKYIPGRAMSVKAFQQMRREVRPRLLKAGALDALDDLNAAAYAVQPKLKLADDAYAWLSEHGRQLRKGGALANKTPGEIADALESTKPEFRPSLMVGALNRWIARIEKGEGKTMAVVKDLVTTGRPNTTEAKILQEILRPVPGAYDKFAAEVAAAKTADKITEVTHKWFKRAALGYGAYDVTQHGPVTRWANSLLGGGGDRWSTQEPPDGGP